MSDVARVVLDTNVLVSALWSSGGNAAAIMELIPTLVVPCYNDAIFSEYIDVLNRAKFDFSAPRKESLLSAMKEFGIVISPSKSSISLIDEDDRIFYDTAQTGGAILITGNQRHFPSEPFIVSPAAFLKSLKRQTLPLANN